MFTISLGIFLGICCAPLLHALAVNSRQSLFPSTWDWHHLALVVIGGFGGGLIAQHSLGGASLPQLILEISSLGLALYTIALDYRKQLIALDVLAMATVIFLLLGFLFGDIPARLLAAGIGMAFFGLQWLATRGKGIGTGDIWLGGVIGLGLGPALVLPAILFGYIIGSIHAVTLIARKRAGRGTKLALGAYLAVGFLAFQLAGDLLAAQWIALLSH